MLGVLPKEATNKITGNNEVNMYKVFKSKIVWIVVGVIAILLVIKVYQDVTQPVFVLPEPPSAVLQIQGVTQKGFACAYGNNVDNFLFVAQTSNKALVITSPFSATLKFATDKLPQTVRIQALDAATLGTPTEESYKSESYFRWSGGCFANNENTALTKDLDLKNEQTFTINLKRGLYIINVWTKWSKYEYDFVVYAFLIEVK